MSIPSYEQYKSMLLECKKEVEDLWVQIIILRNKQEEWKKVRKKLILATEAYIALYHKFYTIWVDCVKDWYEEQALADPDLPKKNKDYSIDNKYTSSTLSNIKQFSKKRTTIKGKKFVWVLHKSDNNNEESIAK